MTIPERPEWRVSLHGGHSGEFCDHAEGTLREMLEAAVTAGYHTFGVSEHAPRLEERFLYSEERALGWDLAKITDDFTRYRAAIQTLAQEFSDRLIVLRGFEAEVVPTAGYVRLMRGFREEKLPDGSPVFDYFVGSVHYVDELQIDGRPETYAKAVTAFGSLEKLAVRYYETVAEMASALRPDVVGHLDLIKKNCAKAGFDPADLETPAVHAALDHALEVIQRQGAILDLNTAGWRKGLGEPYPSPRLIREANRRNIPFCFGDDSHRTAEVGTGIEEARNVLLDCGVSTVTVLTREGDRANGPVVRKTVNL